MCGCALSALHKNLVQVLNHYLRAYADNKMYTMHTMHKSAFCWHDTYALGWSYNHNH